MKKQILLFVTALLLLALPAFADLTPTRTVPADGATGVALSSKIILMFSENVSVGKATCTLNGVALTSTATGKYGMLQPPAFDYATTYTFDAPAGAYVGASGALSAPVHFTFTTVNRPQPAVRSFDAIVAADGSGDYTSVQDAVKAAPTGRTKPWLIFIKKGTYTELVRIPEDKPYIHLIGEDRDSTIIQYKIHCGSAKDTCFQYSSSNIGAAQGESPVVYVASKNFYTENLTYINLWGYETRLFPQALAIKSRADRLAMNNCRLLSYQDTWETTSNESDRHYIKNTFIEGNVDFIYDSGDCYFDSCTISIVKNHRPDEEAGWIVAPSHSSDAKWGYIFMNCGITAPEPNTEIYLGRAWIATPKASFVNTRVDDNIILREEGWDQHFGEAIPIIFADYNTMNSKGELLDLSKRNNYYWYVNAKGDTISGYGQRYLSAQEVAAYTLSNVVFCTDGWRPDIMTQPLDAPVVNVEGTDLVWTANAYAICYEVLCKGSFVAFTTDARYAFSGNASDYQVRPVNEYGSFGRLSAPTGTSAIRPALAGIQVAFENNRILNTGDTPIRVELYRLSGICEGSTILEPATSLSVESSLASFIRVVADGRVKTIHRLVTK